jgi:hypothetical protein
LIILDSNVVSEAWRTLPNSSVVAWLDAQDRARLYLCAPVLAELHFGAERLPAGRRRELLRASIKQLELEGYRDRVLPFDIEAASAFGRIGAMRERVGRRMDPMDAMIAAIALVHGMKLATRDVSGFAGVGLDLINPFEVPAKR